MATERETQSHFYFWGGSFSNFYRDGHSSLFEAPLWGGGPSIRFYHSEGYYMACKALHFGDFKLGSPNTLQAIIDEPIPKTAKVHGRAVKGFEVYEWDHVSRLYMFRAIWFKFIQNPTLLRKLVTTEGKILVEGSPLDKIWGVGLAWDNPAIEDEANWLGLNWLGEVLMSVRHIVLSLDEYEIQHFDPFNDHNPYHASLIA
jgi:ribA/ribD-fused uncharacterized protein